VYIRWTDGPTVKEMEEITHRYKAGSFNGMEDIYEYSRTPFGQIFGTSQYISTSREYSDSMVEAAIDQVYNSLKWNFDNDGLSKPVVSQFRNGELYQVQLNGRHQYGNESVQSEIHQFMSQTSAISLPAKQCA